jgi:hypothetical protein
MKKFTAIFLTAFLLFAQDDLPLPPATDDVLPPAQTAATETQAQIEPVENTQTAQTVPDTTDTNVAIDTAQTPLAKTVVTVKKIFFVGLQTGDIPEIREKLDDIIRTKWGTESDVDFVSKDLTIKIRRKLFLDRKVFVDSLLFAELQKYNLENTILLFISVDNYSIKAVRNRLIFGEIEGKMDVTFTYYDVLNKKELFVTQTNAASKIKKGMIWWKTPQERVNINANDRRNINEELLNYTVEKGFDMMKIAISLKK